MRLSVNVSLLPVLLPVRLLRPLIIFILHIFHRLTDVNTITVFCFFRFPHWLSIKQSIICDYAEDWPPAPVQPPSYSCLLPAPIKTSVSSSSFTTTSYAAVSCLRSRYCNKPLLFHRYIFHLSFLLLFRPFRSPVKTYFLHMRHFFLRLPIYSPPLLKKRRAINSALYVFIPLTAPLRRRLIPQPTRYNLYKRGVIPFVRSVECCRVVRSIEGRAVLTGYNHTAGCCRADTDNCSCVRVEEPLLSYPLYRYRLRPIVAVS